MTGFFSTTTSEERNGYSICPYLNHIDMFRQSYQLNSRYHCLEEHRKNAAAWVSIFDVQYSSSVFRSKLREVER
jgi:hypothetical protein